MSNERSNWHISKFRAKFECPKNVFYLIHSYQKSSQQIFSVYFQVNYQCPVGGETISSSFYVTVFINVVGSILGECTSYSLSSANDLRFFRKVAQNGMSTLESYVVARFDNISISRVVLVEKRFFSLSR